MDKQIFAITTNVTQSIKVPVYFLIITTLSKYMKDACTSIYVAHGDQLLSLEQKSNPTINACCLHWCLPRVPDTWNELLYAHIIAHF